MREQATVTVGRPRRKDKPKKRTYYLPVELADYFVEKMGGDSSKMVGGAMVLIMAVDEAIQNYCRDKARELPPAEAVKDVRAHLPEWLDAMLLKRHVAHLTPAERSRILAIERGKIERAR